MATERNKKENYPIYGIDENELYKLAAEINSGGARKPYNHFAVEILKRVMYIKHGLQKRPITDEDATHMIERGYKLTG
jgi:hypothetical protein